jgi:hypothetical protein
MCSISDDKVNLYSLFTCCLVQDFGQVKVIITKTSKFKPDLNYTLETFITHSLGGSNQGKILDILLGISSCTCQLQNRQSPNKFHSISCLWFIFSDWWSRASHKLNANLRCLFKCSLLQIYTSCEACIITSKAWKYSCNFVFIFITVKHAK